MSRLYLEALRLPDDGDEFDCLLLEKRTCFSSRYPFGIFPGRLERLQFAPITVLYGGNGSGKTTLLNVLCEKLRLTRDTRYNRSAFFDRYVDLVSVTHADIPPHSRCITSDDVFDFMLSLRAISDGVDAQRERLYMDYVRNADPDNPFRLQSMADYDKLRDINMARHRTQSEYVRRHLADQPRERSNGESALMYFQQRLGEGGLYLLDEPENSLSPAKQLELAQFLEESVRFFDCQLVIATHSPFLAALRGATVYDMDATPIVPCRWTELPGVRVWHDFFEQHRHQF